MIPKSPLVQRLGHSRGVHACMDQALLLLGGWTRWLRQMGANESVQHNSRGSQAFTGQMCMQQRLAELCKLHALTLEAVIAHDASPHNQWRQIRLLNHAIILLVINQPICFKHICILCDHSAPVFSSLESGNQMAWGFPWSASKVQHLTSI